MARSLMMRVARSQLFPCSGNGGKEHENRAGDKLAELSEFTDLLDGIPSGSAFLDLCGGPGAWSQHLLEKKDLSLRGFGFTLKANSGGADDWKAQEKDEWYDDLYRNPKWTALWGADGTGDLLKPSNLEHCVKQLSREQVLLCVADGGFSDDAIPQNLQELYFYRLLLAELLTAVSCLSPGGKFVCKLYTSFSASTSALLFLTTRLFDSVEIVKPVTSKALRIGGSAPSNCTSTTAPMTCETLPAEELAAHPRRCAKWVDNGDTAGAAALNTGAERERV